MNGNRFLLDTNVLLYLTGGKLDLTALPEGDFSISFVTELKVLSYPSITIQEEERLRRLLSEIPIIDIYRHTAGNQRPGRRVSEKASAQAP